MKCPNCKNDSYKFIKLYTWPFGKKLCPVCNKYSKFKKNWLLGVISFSMGLMLPIPTLLFGSAWYLLPSAAIVLCVDYFMDKKFRELVIV
jgi:hypothetical protein